MSISFATSVRASAHGTSRNGERIFINYGKAWISFTEILDISNSSSNRTTIRDTLHKDILVDAFWGVFQFNNLNINLNDKCFERKLQRR
jgi:hypothetical protein